MKQVSLEARWRGDGAVGRRRRGRGKGCKQGGGMYGGLTKGFSEMGEKRPLRGVVDGEKGTERRRLGSGMWQGAVRWLREGCGAGVACQGEGETVGWTNAIRFVAQERNCSQRTSLTTYLFFFRSLFHYHQTAPLVHGSDG